MLHSFVVENLIFYQWKYAKFVSVWLSAYAKIKEGKKIAQTSLYSENLLSNHRQYLQVNAVKLIKAGPSSAGQEALQTHVRTHTDTQTQLFQYGTWEDI